MKLLSTAVAALSIAAFAGPVLADAASGNTESVIAARAALDQWVGAFNARDLDALMAQYDDEIVYLNAGAPAAVGSEAVRASFQGMFGAVEGFTLRYQELQAFGGADMAVLIGTYMLEPPAGVEVPAPTGRVSLVYRLTDDGTWKLIHDIDNNPPDATPAVFQ